MLVIYTAIFDDYDTLKQPEKPNHDCRLVCITNTNQSQHGWETISPPPKIEITDPIRLARYCKLMPHLLFPEATTSVWIDGTYTINTSATAFATDALCKTDIAAYLHFYRTCIYDEADEVDMLQIDDRNIIKNHVRRLLASGYPANNGLHDTSIIVRRHTDKIAEFNELWWEQLSTGSRRDQLSFDYCLWSLGLECAALGPGHTRNPLMEPAESATPHFVFTEHQTAPKMVGNEPFRVWLDNQA